MAATKYPTATVLFAGGGGSECGLIAAGIDPVQRIEFDPEIAAVNEANFGPGVICDPCESVDLSKLSPTDYLFASPPCQSHSVARSKKLPDRDDAEVGICILDYARVLKPRGIVIENVPGYANHPIFAAIVQGLMGLGYFVQWGVLNSADFAVPQTRKRLILRAIHEGERMVPLTATHSKTPQPAGLFQEDLFGPALLPWNGWYAAIEDLIPGLPDSQLAPWQKKRLPPEFWESVTEPTLIEGTPVGKRPPTCGTSADPCMTINGGGGGRLHRAFLVHGSADNDRIVSMSPRAVARFQSFPDSYQLPVKKSLAGKIIGNAAPPLLMQRIAETFLAVKGND